MRIRKETLPIALYKNGKWELSDPYDHNGYITCTVYGEMCDGVKIWQDENGKQYTRQKLYGKYYFCEM